MLIVGRALFAVACGDDDDESAGDGTTAVETTVEGTTAANATEDTDTVLDNLERAVKEGAARQHLLEGGRRRRPGGNPQWRGPDHCLHSH
jgi:hypothetical protein